MRWGTALVTDVAPKTLQEYDGKSLEELAGEPNNFTIPNESVISLTRKADRPNFRAREFWVKWTMRRQKEPFQVYSFVMTYQKGPGGTAQVQFYAVPLGAYFKPRRQVQTREVVLREYADSVQVTFREALPLAEISQP